MGIDIEVAVKGDTTWQEVAQANYLLEQAAEADNDYYFEKYRLRGKTASLSSTMRYYGPGYERGDWPAIAHLLREGRRVFPGRTILYGDDAGDWWDEASYTEVDDEFLASMDAYWAANGNTPYDEQKKAVLA
jgi:hypothetical protein